MHLELVIVTSTTATCVWNIMMTPSPPRRFMSLAGTWCRYLVPGTLYSHQVTWNRHRNVTRYLPAVPKVPGTWIPAMYHDDPHHLGHSSSLDERTRRSRQMYKCSYEWEMGLWSQQTNQYLVKLHREELKFHTFSWISLCAKIRKRWFKGKKHFWLKRRCNQILSARSKQSHGEVPNMIFRKEDWTATNPFA